MKYFAVVFVSVCFLFGAIKSAVLDPVVAELQNDNAQNSATESQLSKNDDCIQPKETGRCFALFYRFAYDVEKRECVEFIYGGCSGNSNNFETKEDCETKCLQNKQTSSENDDGSKTTVSPNSVSDTSTEQATFVQI